MYSAITLRFDLELALSEDLPLIKLIHILREFKNSGGKQVDAVNILDALRVESNNGMEMVILELMDFATGFCSPHMRIWD